MIYCNLKKELILQRIILPVLMLINIILSLFGGMKISAADDLTEMNRPHIIGGNPDVVTVFMMSCLIVSIVLILMKEECLSVICFLAKLVPAAGLIRMLIQIYEINAEYQLNIAEINISATGWIQIIVIIATMVVSIYESVYCMKRKQHR